MIVVRYADDAVVGFQHRAEAERFLEELRCRLAEFGLELHPDKTRLIEFGRFAESNRRRRGDGKPETFNFLGFTHISGKTQKGWFTVLRQTIRSRLRAKLHEVKEALRRRMHAPIPETGSWLASVIRGHFQYYGVPGNQPALSTFRLAITRMWRQILLRRSQTARIPWQRMARLVKRWFPTVRLYHPYPNQRLVV